MDGIIRFIETNWISIVGATIGLIYLILEFRANVWMWAASIVMALFYIYIFYTTKLYASMGIYVYFFGASIYGWIVWISRGKNKDTGEDIITHVPKKYIILLAIALTISFFLIYFILKKYSQNDTIITLGDSLTTALNIVALWMISRKWAEQWLLVIPANLISAILLFLQHDVMSSILFSIFFIVSFFGYFNWKRKIHYQIK